MMKKRKSTKRIEESATTALKLALLKCPILETYIDSNDKTQKKKTLEGVCLFK